MRILSSNVRTETYFWCLGLREKHLIIHSLISVAVTLLWSTGVNGFKPQNPYHMTFPQESGAVKTDIGTAPSSS